MNCGLCQQEMIDNQSRVTILLNEYVMTVHRSCAKASQETATEVEKHLLNMFWTIPHKENEVMIYRDQVIEWLRESFRLDEDITGLKCQLAVAKLEIAALTDCLNGSSKATYTAEMFDKQLIEAGQKIVEDCVSVLLSMQRLGEISYITSRKAIEKIKGVTNELYRNS